jgi:hypothetical protein
MNFVPRLHSSCDLDPALGRGKLAGGRPAPSTFYLNRREVRHPAQGGQLQVHGAARLAGACTTAPATQSGGQA